MKNKYIIVHDGIEETPVLFEETLIHKYVASGHPVVSGGFFEVDGEGIIAYGESTSLGVKSRPIEDANLIKRMLFENK